MTVYELIQVLSRYHADTQVCVSQKPTGYVTDLLYHTHEDEMVKLYGDGVTSADGKEQSRR
jgi:hypothetical protein